MRRSDRQLGLENIFLHSEAGWILPSWEYMEEGRAFFSHEITQENTVAFIQGHFSGSFFFFFLEAGESKITQH